ncbi:hypothetical protein ABZX85_48450 [Streptomyces sp. NPDC004539]|uniref:hypothetical protein n=1 Tax=Streptomyces sp. NPDC004539 TaxID=3154280 RepID=UPI0033AE5074
MMPPAKPLTCGARIRVEPRLIPAPGPGTPGGLLRSSVQCRTAAHGHGPHWGVLRDTAWTGGRPGWPTWTSWTGRPAGLLSVHVLPFCPHTPACSLAADHPGVCSPLLDPALSTDPGRTVEIDQALKTLTAHAQGSGGGTDEAAQAAHDAALLTWDELRARPRILDALPEGDLATVHRLIGRSGSVPVLDEAGVRTFLREVTEVTRLWGPGPRDGRRLTHGQAAEFWLGVLTGLPPDWQAAALSGRYEQILPPPGSPQRPSLAEGPGCVPFHGVLQYARRQTAAGHHPPSPVPHHEHGGYREEDRTLGADLATRLAALPYGWRADAVRRIAYGTTPLDALSEAAQAVNALRHHGIRLAWNRT